LLRDTTNIVVSGTGPGPLSVPVLPDQDIVCTISNERKSGTVLFEKRVVGGEGMPSDWTFAVNDISVAHDERREFYIGSYMVTEDGGSGNNGNYDLTGAGGICTFREDDVILTVTEVGGTCIITNTAEMLPEIELVKAAEPDGLVEPGGSVTFSVEISNTSLASIPVTLTSLIDDVYGDVTDGANLAVSNSSCMLDSAIHSTLGYTCTFEAKVSGKAGDIITNVITATVISARQRVATAFDDAQVKITVAPVARLDVTKKAVPEILYEPGGMVRYDIKATNSSSESITLTLTSLQDDMFGDLADPANTAISMTTCISGTALAPADSYECSFESKVTGVAGDVLTDVVTVTAITEAGSRVEDADDAVVTLVVEPPDTGAPLSPALIVLSFGMVGMLLAAGGAWVWSRVGRMG
jgi:hypothetical protein